MNKKGSILMITLWVVALLAIFAVGLGYRSSLSLRLAKYQRDRLRAYYLAWAGINQAIAAPEPRPQFLEKKWDDGGYFECNLSYEEGKLNINRSGDPDFDRNKLFCLFAQAQLPDSEASDLSIAVIDWMSADTKVEIAKKAPLRAPEELILILENFYQLRQPDDYRRPAQELFNKIKKLITTYGDGKVNFNTASPQVLEIIFRAQAKQMVDNNEPDAQNASQVIPDLLSAIDLYRQKAAKGEIQYLSAEDINVQAIKDALGIGDDMDNLIIRSTPYFNASAGSLRVEAKGSFGNTVKKVFLVYDSRDKSIVSWREN